MGLATLRMATNSSHVVRTCNGRPSVAPSTNVRRVKVEIRAIPRPCFSQFRPVERSAARSMKLEVFFSRTFAMDKHQRVLGGSLHHGSSISSESFQKHSSFMGSPGSDKASKWANLEMVRKSQLAVAALVREDFAQRHDTCCRSWNFAAKKHSSIRSVVPSRLYRAE